MRPFLAVQLVLLAALAALSGASCKARTVQDAEAARDVAWLETNGSPEAVAALGRVADNEAKAVRALESRAAYDVNVYIAAWGAVTRKAAWGTTFLRAGLTDPSRTEMASSAMPRRDPQLVPFVGDLEASVVRLAAGHRGSVVAGILASVGPAAHQAVERRLVDGKTRTAMCDGIGLPEASGDAKSLLLAVPPEARDQPSCVADVMEMAAKEDAVVGWLATGAESGLMGAVAKGDLPCPRVAKMWGQALTERPAETHAPLTVPLQQSIHRCASALDPVIADVLAKTPGARTCIVQAIDPYGGDLSDMKTTCKAMREPYMQSESARIRQRVSDALARGCRFAN